LNTVGYKELFAFLKGKYSLETAVAEIKKNTRRFAKRQLTWFRKDPEIQWFDYQTPIEEIEQFIKQKMG
jgi:tRNA dimethylallyltransferase